jgi:hypothetical protein
MIVKGLNDASREPKLHPLRDAGEMVQNPKSGKIQWKYKTSLTPAEVNCALCACAALCAHIFRDVEYTSGKVLRVMWEKIINTKKQANLSLSKSEQKIQQHQLSFQYFLEAFKSGTAKKEPWKLVNEPRAEDIDHVNRTQQDGMKEFIEIELKRKEKILEKLGKKEVKVRKPETNLSLKDAFKLIGEKGPNWIFALLVIGEGFSAEPGSEAKSFGHWNFAYLTRDKKARFVDYQGKEAVRSEWPICAAANNLLAEPGRQKTYLIAANTRPWWELIPQTTIRPRKKASEPKQKDPSRPHRKAARDAAIRRPTGFPKNAETVSAVKAVGSPAPQQRKPKKVYRERNGSPEKRRPRARRSPKK